MLPVSGRAIERLRRPLDASHDFRERRVLVVAQTRAVLVVRQEQVPQSLRPRIALELFHQRERLPAVALCYLVLEPCFVRIDVFVHERGQARHELLGAVRIAQIHSAASFRNSIQSN